MVNFLRSVAAGMMIGIGATVYLSCEDRVVGALLFSVGLFLICSFGMHLFTGKIGYVLANRNKPNCLVIWLGNLTGCVLLAAAVRVARPALHQTAAQMVANKLALPWYAVLLLGFCCGLLMYAAVENFRRHPHEISGIAGVILCVSVFILCGFEHSIADMCYCAFAVASPADAWQSLLFLLLVTVGNSLGALALRGLTQLEPKQA